MNHRHVVLAPLLAAALFDLLASGAHAAIPAPLPNQGNWTTSLQARDLDGNVANGAEAFYDTMLGITWLANANAAQATPYDTRDPDDTDGRFGTATDGQLSPLDALLWAEQLDVGGVTGWRLPQIRPIDGVAFRYSEKDFYSGHSDAGFNVMGANTELGHLHYVTLGMPGAFDSQGREMDRDELFARFNPGPFTNVGRSASWIGQKYFGPVRNNEPAMWRYEMMDGGQFGTPTYRNATAWAVHDGDVGHAMPVPEPQVWVSMLAGLVAVAASAARRRPIR